jgi:SARP family transcriptional regulator, regulator of embCAB operon
MKINILGPLEMFYDDVSVLPTARKPRQVLALLSVWAGQLVPMPALIEELWGPVDAPRSATQLVQTYIMRLRQRIDEAVADDGEDAKQILITRPGGYTLAVAREDIDVHQFQTYAQSGERMMEAGDFEAASDLLGKALDIWRGPVLVDVRAGCRLGVEIERLKQNRLAVLESRIDADMYLGRHHKLLGELAELTALYPLHEKLCEQYMTALFASGCKWKALEVYRRLRQRLIEELGVEPSLSVQHVQRAILNSDVDREDVALLRAPASAGAMGA